MKKELTFIIKMVKESYDSHLQSNQREQPGSVFLTFLLLVRVCGNTIHGVFLF